MADQQIVIFHLEIPLAGSLVTAAGTVVSRDVALVRLGEGPFGWGEAAPYPGQDEQFELVLRAVRTGERTPTLLAALDEAAADHEAKSRKVSLSEGLGGLLDAVPVSLAVGLDDPAGVVDRAVSNGVRRFKLKIEPGHLGHVREIRAGHPDIILGLDANGSFDDDTLAELFSVDDLGVAYLEQPVTDLLSDAARELASVVDVPVFADESVRSVEDAAEILGFEHVAGVVVKPGRLGWSGALVVRDLANASGKLWRASGLLETGVGRSYTDLLAACPDAFVSDVAPAEWFLTSGVTPSRLAEGRISIPAGPGIGVEPDATAIEALLVERLDFSG